jgi:hypothetical protein
MSNTNEFKIFYFTLYLDGGFVDNYYQKAENISSLLNHLGGRDTLRFVKVIKSSNNSVEYVDHSKIVRIVNVSAKED